MANKLKGKYVPGEINVQVRNRGELNPQPELNYLAWWLDHRRKQLEQNMKDTGTYPLEYSVPLLEDFVEQRERKAGYEPGRVALNKEIYKQLNNAASATYSFSDELPEGEQGRYFPKLHSVEIAYDADDSTLLHELTHASNRGRLKESPQEKKIKQYGDPIDPEVTNEYIEFFGEKQTQKENDYLRRPTEIYSRLMQFRKEHNLDPSRKYSVKEIKQLMENTETVSGIDRFSPEIFTRMLNEVAQNNPTQQNNEQQTYYVKQGGKFKWYKPK